MPENFFSMMELKYPGEGENAGHTIVMHCHTIVILGKRR